MKFKINIDSKEHEVEARADGTVTLDGETFAAKVTNPGADRRLVQVGDTTYEIRTVDDCTDAGVAVLELAGERIPLTVTGVTKGARWKRRRACRWSRRRDRGGARGRRTCGPRGGQGRHLGSGAGQDRRTCGSRWATRWPRATWCSSWRP